MYERLFGTSGIATALQNVLSASYGSDSFGLGRPAADNQIEALSKALLEYDSIDELEADLDSVLGSVDESLPFQTAEYWNLSISLENPAMRLIVKVIAGYLVFLFTFGLLVLDPVLWTALASAGGLGYGTLKWVGKWTDQATNQLQGHKGSANVYPRVPKDQG